MSRATTLPRWARSAGLAAFVVAAAVVVGSVPRRDAPVDPAEVTSVPAAPHVQAKGMVTVGPGGGAAVDPTCEDVPGTDLADAERARRREMIQQRLEARRHERDRPRTP